MKPHSLEYVKEYISEMGFYLLNNKEYKNSSCKIHFSDFEGYKYSLSFQAVTALNRKNYRPNKFSAKNEYVYDNINLWISKNNMPFSYSGGNFINAHAKCLLFKCHYCEHVWETNWSNIMGGQICPSFNCKGVRASERGRKKSLSKSNNLEFLFPEISKEWDYEKNTLSPKDYCSMSDTKVYWICPICEKSYFSAIKNRCLGYACPICKSSKGEKRILEYIVKNEIKFVRQKRFPDCKRKKTLPFDFYLPEYNLCIEYNGEQHYKPSEFFGGKKSFKYRQENDLIKKSYCDEKGIGLLIISYLDYDIIEIILSNISRRI